MKSPVSSQQRTSGWLAVLSSGLTLALLLTLYAPAWLPLLSSLCGLGLGLLLALRPVVTPHAALIGTAIIIMNGLTLVTSAA